MEDALLEIIAAVKSDKDISALAKYSLSSPSLPAPVACDISVCGAAAPQCFTQYEPRVGYSIESLREIPNGVTQDTSTWTLGLSWFDVAGVKKAEDRGAGYLDKKFIYTSSSTDEPLVLRIVTESYNHIWLCQVQKGFLKYPAGMAELNVGAEVRIVLHSTNNAVATEKGESVRAISQILLILNSRY